MNSKIFKTYKVQKKSFISFAFRVLLLTIVLGCTSTKKIKEKRKILATSQKYGHFISNGTNTTSASEEDLGLDDHSKIYIKAETIKLLSDSLTQSLKIEPENRIYSPEIPHKETKSAVANKIVENYLKSKNKEPGGHCLAVSKKRFERAYKDVHGHSVYDDLPSSIATTYYTPREVFNYLYVSASGTHKGWRSLPKKYRGKGNAGAIAYAGMGILIDEFGIWNGKLKPGAPMQVWKHRKEYEQVIRGVNKKGFDPFGHSFIFIDYVRDEKNKIIGIKIADQGYQSYRSLVPNDYEVWWAVNLII